MNKLLLIGLGTTLLIGWSDWAVSAPLIDQHPLELISEEECAERRAERDRMQAHEKQESVAFFKRWEI